MIAKVALSAAIYAIDKPYDYLVPTELETSIQVGVRVMVPFGTGNRPAEGIVLSLCQDVEYNGRVKAIRTQLDEVPLISPKGIKLALWMRERCFCTLHDAIRVMLPAGLYFSLQQCWKLVEGIDQEEAYHVAGSMEGARKLLDLLFSKDGAITQKEIRMAFGTKDPNPALKRLSDGEIIILEPLAQRGVGDKTEKMVRLLVAPEVAIKGSGVQRKLTPLQYQVIQALSDVGKMSMKELRYFTGASLSTVKTLVTKKLVALEEEEVYRRVEVTFPLAKGEPVVLNQEQQQAFEGLCQCMMEEKPSAALLYGVTGSGKTQVYIKLIGQALSQSKTAMVLVPEIALTPQLLRIFTSHFGEEVAILHSQLPMGERYDEWKRVRDGVAKVVVGTRSAIFAPLTNIGVIILDEEQEYSYKSEQIPRYHARDIAKYRCAQEGALLLLGSATPSVETMYWAQQGQYHLFTLKERYNQRALPPVHLVDMKQELKHGNDGPISGYLMDAISQTVARGEQVILFLNRRGNSRMLVCGQCGLAPTCPHCSVHLTYHSANGRMMCHYCGHSEPMEEICPHCAGRTVFVGEGTQKVEEALSEVFSPKDIMRMDADTISAKDNHAALLARFEHKKIPILIGTQMIAKGLDFPNVTLVGVISGDQSLYIDDYRAGERTFSLLTQVVGRSGRGAQGGQAIIQTFTPNHDIIGWATEQNYDDFYQGEIKIREMCGSPPFRDYYVFTLSGTQETLVQRTGRQLKQVLQSWLSQPPYNKISAEILGPVPASVIKVNNQYRYKMTVATKDCKEMRHLTAHLLQCIQQDKTHRGTHVSADINPID